MRNTVDVTGGKPFAVLLQSISDLSAINPLVAFYDILGGKREFSKYKYNTSSIACLSKTLISLSFDNNCPRDCRHKSVADAKSLRKPYKSSLIKFLIPTIDAGKYLTFIELADLSLECNKYI
jgi:hypothetical protein